MISMERLDYVNSKAFLAQQHAKLKEPDNAQYLERYNDLMCLLKECPDEFIKSYAGQMDALCQLTLSRMT